MNKKMMELDKLVKIEGTMYDARRKMSSAMIKEARELRNEGMAYAKIAEKFSVSVYTIMKYTKPEFAESERKRVAAYNMIYQVTHREQINRNHRIATAKRIEKKVQLVKNLIED